MSINKKVRELVYKKYNCKCAYCGVDLKEMKDNLNPLKKRKNIFGKRRNKMRVEEFRIFVYFALWNI